MDLYLRQEQLEQEMLAFSKIEFDNRINTAREREQESGTVYGSIAFDRSIEPTLTNLNAWITRAKTSCGVRHNVVDLIDQLGVEPECLAYITCRQVIDRLTRKGTMQSIAIQLGAMIEDEARARVFAAQHGDVMKQLEPKVKTSTTYTRRKAILSAVSRKMDFTWRSLTPKQHLALGSLLIETFCYSTGLAKIVAVASEKRGGTWLVPTKECLAWIEATLARNELLAPFRWPMVVPPLKWSDPWSGGYLSINPLKSPLPFVKARNKGHLRKLEQIGMPEVYRAVNLMQETPFVINTRVLDVLKELWSRSMETAGLPSREDKELPPRPHDIETNETARKDWSRAASKVHKWNETTRSKRVQITKTLWLADKFKEFERIYFPYTADFRGRLYCAPNFLNPQGPDNARALLLFANGKPLGNDEAPGWLAVHIANCFGVDKATFDGRIQWVEEHQEQILQSAADPINYRWWCEADDPFLFLAGCFEWEGYTREGGDYVCRLPVTMDGSCNGLQHFSAMLRDPVGGAAVNLIPTDKPADIYGEVARVVTSKLREKVIHGDINAEKWLSTGVNRKITKRPVMVLPYGGTRQSMMTYVEEALDEVVKKTGHSAWQNGDNTGTYTAATYLAPIVWEGINEVVVAARAAMDWLQKVGNYLAKEGHSIEWTTPDGFVAQQSYRKQEGERFKLHLVGRGMMEFRIFKDTDKLDSRKQASGISPNFVHSLDATALRWYVLMAVENGIENFMVIHDSYGALPSDVTMMGKCLRQAFVDMYEENDVLEQFRQAALAVLPEDKHDKIPPVPPKGTLDLQLVNQSDYFFA